MSNAHKIFYGNIFSDDRGSLSFVNDFSLQSAVRFYEIKPKDTSVIRAWQGHKKESKWFYCTHGSFKIKLVQLDSFENPSENVDVFSYELNSDTPKILFIPGGYANGFKANTEGSKLLVFSNFDLEASKQDDYRYESDKWVNKW